MPARKTTPRELTHPDLTARLGRAMQVLRTELGLSRRELAERAELSYSYLSEIETGKKETSSKTLFRLADVLGVTPSELMVAAEERVHALPPAAEAPEPAIGAPMSAMLTPTAPIAAETAPSASPSESGSRWFGSRRASQQRQQLDADHAAQDRRELIAILDRLEPEDRELLLGFGRRLNRS
jgi:transcriptional regulator with XRE-family HTH domain